MIEMAGKNDKTGFLLYFDSYPAIAGLDAEQRGLLLSALYVYADRVWRDETVSMEEILDQFPAMDGQTRTACGFMGANILRDTRKWLSQRELRSQRRPSPRKLAETVTPTSGRRSARAARTPSAAAAAPLSNERMLILCSSARRNNSSMPITRGCANVIWLHSAAQQSAMSLRILLISKKVSDVRL